MFKLLLTFIFILFLILPLFAEVVDTAWVRRYDNPLNGDDHAYAIAVDDTGNVYVTGQSYGITGYDCATVKYDQQGNKLWVKRYNGTGNSYDVANAIAVDVSGNVYVTGYSYGSGTYADYAIIKYDSNGNQLWVQVYNGLGNSYDEARAIALDKLGNVYVTGKSHGSGTGYDYVTIKYYPDGDTAWTRRYNGPGNDIDCPRGIAVDNSGNVYVTGYSYDSGTSLDYATIKYDLQGNQLWVQRYDGPGNGDDVAYAIALDNSGNVYVSGYGVGTGTYEDYITIKYDPQGNQVWVKIYNGPSNGWDYALAMALDNPGNVYVTGYRYEGDYTTIKYDPQGNELWVKAYDGPGNFTDIAHAIAVDKFGNIYVTGKSYGDGTSEDYATIKYNPQGNQIWVQRYNGPGNFYDEAWAIAVDNSGNVYVTGESEGTGTSYDFATIKYVQLLRGDTDGDKKLSVSDVIYLINYLFKGGPLPIPELLVADSDCDSQVTISDVIYLINYLFRGGPSPGC